MVAMVVTGLLMAALGMSMVVVLRQQNNSTGRMNNASSEQAVGALLPADLASSETVDSTAGARPCPSGKCPSGFTIDGSNALMASWSKVVDPGPPVVTKETRVSWRYRLVGSGYQILRAECVEGSPTWTCSQRVVLHDAPPPPNGTTFTPGATAPTWAMKVVNPLAADVGSYDPTGSLPGVDPATARGARRVIVAVDGGGDGEGSSGGAAAISLTSGSTARQGALDPDSLPPPTIPALKSRCGGNFSLVIDRSGSIGSDNMKLVSAGLTELKKVFQGTPIKLQLVAFATKAYWYSGSSWVSDTPRWFDMLDPNDAIKFQAGVDSLESGGGTNYEHGFYRAFRNNDKDGTEQAIVPTTLLFFTDGDPTGSRRTWGWQDDVATATNPKNWVPAIDPVYSLPGSEYMTQDQLNRAQYWPDVYRSIRMIGVGVGMVTTHPSFKATIADLVAGRVGASGSKPRVDAVLQNGSYINGDTANLYMTPDWNLFAAALESVALGMCGGTVTVQTVDQSGNANDSAVSYSNTRIVDSDNVEVPPLSTTVTTTPQYPGGTFDFSIPGGDFVNVTISPADLTELDLLAPVGWSCKVRGVNRAVTTTPISGSVWSTVTVKVQANEPVSCELTVQPA
jgi:hypothetical protein